MLSVSKHYVTFSLQWSFTFCSHFEKKMNRTFSISHKNCFVFKHLDLFSFVLSGVLFNGKPFPIHQCFPNCVPRNIRVLLNIDRSQVSLEMLCMMSPCRLVVCPYLLKNTVPEISGTLLNSVFPIIR
jgi:hypothetical protein